MLTSFRTSPAYGVCLLGICLSLCLGACSKSDGHHALDDQGDHAQSAHRVEGTWAIDGEALLRQELGDSMPDVAQEFMNSYRVGYEFRDGTASYRVATPGAEDVLDAEYEIVEEHDDATFLRVFAAEDDDEAQELLGDATHFEIRFQSDDDALFIAWHKEPRTDEDDDLHTPNPDDEELTRFPLKRLSAEAYDAHFVIETVEAPQDLETAFSEGSLEEVLQEEGEIDAETQKKLVGHWILDEETTAQNLYYASKDVDPFLKRFSPLFMHFDEEGKIYGGEVEPDGVEAMHGTYRVMRLFVVNQTRRVIEITPDPNDERQRMQTSHMRVSVLNDDAIILDPVLYVEYLHTQNDSPVFQRVDEKTFEHYVSQDPTQPKIDEKAQKTVATSLEGHWLLHVEKTLKDESEEERENFQLGFVINPDGAWGIYGRHVDETQTEAGAFTVLDAQENYALVALAFDEESLSDLLIVERTGEDTFEIIEPINEYRSPNDVEAGRMYFERVEPDAFEATFHVENAP